MDLVLERAATPEILSAIRNATAFDDLAEAFTTIFEIIAQPDPPKSKTDYLDAKSDFGLKARGIKTRENLNAMAREILNRVHDSEDLTAEDADVLRQYSGRGGLTENSQFEYYTPTPIAAGVWDVLALHGVQSGNVCDPCTGAGVFPSTKPEGVVVTGVDIDPVGSKIAQLFNPEDSIKAGAFESLVMATDDDSFDSVVGNVPFGSARGASMHEDPAYKSEKRIERYFLLRAADKCRPGGLICLVVPINIVGAKSEKWRRFRIAMSKKAEFLGAHKLPSKSFGAQGTDTVVDIVVFKKHPRDLLDKIDDIDFETLKDANVIWDEFVDGLYWKGEGKKYIQGKYVPKIEGDRWSREIVDGDIDAATIRKKLAVRFDSRIDWDALEVAPAEPKTYIDGDRRIINGRQHEFVSGRWTSVVESVSDDMAIDAGKYGVTSLQELKTLLSTPDGALRLTAQQVFAVYKAWPDLLSSLARDAIEFAMSQDDESLQEQAYRGSIIGGLLGRLKANPDDMERERLQGMVTAEMSRYGHPKNNNRLRLTGSSSRMFGLFMNSVDEKGAFSDFLAGTMEDARIQYDSTNIQSVVEHLYLREGIHAIELEDIAKLYTGQMKIDSLGDLANIDNIAVTPDGFIMPMGRYCAGDVYPKLADMTAAMADEEDDRIKAKWQQQIDYIKSRVKLTAAEDISIGLQEKWFPKRYLVEFLRENGYPRLTYGRIKEVEEEDPLSGETIKKKRFVEDFDTSFGEFFGIEGQGFPNQFLKFLNGGKVTSSKQENIEAYKNEVAAITENFNAWMQQHPDMDQVAALYNRKFNAFLPFEYEESDLGIVGLSEKIKPHGYQNSAIRRMSEEGRGIIGLDVGLGKTLAAISLHLYNKQMGRTKKTCITVPNSVLSNWYQEIDKAVTDMNDVLFVGVEPKLDKNGSVEREPVLDEAGQQKVNKFTGEPEFQAVLIKRNAKEDIWKKMWEIPTTSKSLVVMTKEKFGSIPLHPDTKAKYAQNMAKRSLISDKLAKDMSKGGDAENAISYDAAVAQMRAEAMYADEGTAKKGELPYFEDMGFTSVIGDEFHEFKNSYQAKETKDIVYLPSAPSSQRALDMTMKSAFLRESNDGRGVYPLTATPVTNSPFEVYNMLSYVAPFEEFERFGVYTVDDFVRVFGKIEQVDKVMVSGEVKTKDGLVGFRNLDGLRNLFHKYCILQNADDVGLELPPHDEANEEVELNERQMTIYNGLRVDAEEAAKPGSKVSMFSVIREMDRITTDEDLFDKQMTFLFKKSDKEKARSLAANLPEMVTSFILDEGKKIKTQISVSPTFREEGDSFVMVVPEEAEEHVATRLARYGIDENDVSHPLMPKYAKLVENIRAHLEANGKQIVFTEEKSQHRKIKRILSHHVPLSRNLIAIINADEAEGTKLQKISDAYNAGEVKVVICNKKAEVGVNLQKGTTAIHHLTLPWTPASIQQRNGRGVRQGNTAKNVKIYYYLGAKSFDYYRLDLLQRKSGWMHELFNGTDIEAENANALSNDDMLDLLAANPEEAKRRRMERLEKQKAEREEREKRRTINLLQQLGNVVETLATIEAKKEQRREKLTASVEKLKTEIADIKERGSQLEPGDKARAPLAKKLSSKQERLAKDEAALAGLDEAYEKKQVELESKRKQVKNVLKLKAQKGELPFDANLIDHPDQVVTSLSGTLYAVGDVYEYKVESSGYRETYSIYRVIKVFTEPKAVQLEVVVGDDYYLLKTYVQEISERVILLKDLPQDMVKVTLSEKELAVKKLLAGRIRYSALIESAAAGTIDRESFLENLDAVSLTGSVLARADGGGFAIEDSYDIDKSRVVFPESGPDFKKAVAEAYLSLQRGGESTYSARDIVEAVFGPDYENAIVEYGKEATETEIRTAFADFVSNWLDEHLEKGANETDSRKIKEVLLSYDFTLQSEKAMKDLGDNAEFIREIAGQCSADLNADLTLKSRKSRTKRSRPPKRLLKTIRTTKRSPRT